MHLGIMEAAIEKDVIDLDLQGHFGLTDLLLILSVEGRGVLQRVPMLLLSNVNLPYIRNGLIDGQQEKNHLDRWLTENNLDVKSEGN